MILNLPSSYIQTMIFNNLHSLLEDSADMEKQTAAAHSMQSFLQLTSAILMLLFFDGISCCRMTIHDAL